MANRRLVSVLACVAVLATSRAALAAKCRSHLDCDGDQLCSAATGECVSPSAERASARTQDPSGAAPVKTGWELGARLGFALPMGKLDGGTNPDGSSDPMTRFVKRGVPVEVDVGFRIVPNLYLGGYLAHTFGAIGSELAAECGSTVDCSVYTFRAGFQVLYHVLPAAEIDPWFGLGIGYEQLGIDMSSATTTRTASLTFGGVELACLQAGADYRLSSTTGIGPFASFAMGRYGSDSGSLSGWAAQSGPLAHEAIHEWLTLGLRGTFVL